MLRKYLRIQSRASNDYAFLTALLFLANQLLEIFAIYLSDEIKIGICAWDCAWYSGIVQGGYDVEPHAHPKQDAANWAFFPLLPILSKGLGYLLGISPADSVILTGKIFFFLSILAFMKMGREYFPNMNAAILGAVVAFNPYSLYGNVGYTEPAFLFFTSTFFLLLKRKNYIFAGFVGAMLTSVRLTGISAFFSYLLIIAINYFKKSTFPDERIVFGLLLVPLGLALFMLYLYQMTGDALAFAHIQRAWGRVPGNPMNVIIEGLQGNADQRYLAISVIVPSLGTLIYHIKRRNPELVLFSLICTLLPLSTGLWEMMRYIYWQAPVLLALAALLSWRSIWVALFPIFMTGQVIMYTVWFAGK